MAGGATPGRGASRGEPRPGDPPGGTPGDREPRPRRIRVLLAVAVTVLLADMISKAVVVAVLAGHRPVRLLGGVLTLQVLRNSGAAFSIGGSMTVVFTLIAVGVIVFILRTARRLRSLPWAVTFGLLLGGATGNLMDRLARSPGPLRGDVVDWIQLPHWPVFNLADSAIVCGGALAILLSIRGIRMDGTRDGVREEEPRPGGGVREAAAGPPGSRAGGAAPDRGAREDVPGPGAPGTVPDPGTPGTAHGAAGAPGSEVGGGGVRQP